MRIRLAVESRGSFYRFVAAELIYSGARRCLPFSLKEVPATQRDSFKYTHGVTIY